MTTTTTHTSPVGQTAVDGSKRRAERSVAYRNARDEYAAIAELRKDHPIAAHLRERRFELDMTQDEVAALAGTKASYLSKVENGKQIPTLPVLQRILAALGEDLLLVFQARREDAEGVEREEARLPALATA